MDVPLAINDNGIRFGLKGYRESTSFCQNQSVCDLSAFFALTE